jgi:hypothetical protein
MYVKAQRERMRPCLLECMRLYANQQTTRSGKAVTQQVAGACHTGSQAALQPKVSRHQEINKPISLCRKGGHRSAVVRVHLYHIAVAVLSGEHNITRTVEGVMQQCASA